MQGSDESFDKELNKSSDNLSKTAVYTFDVAISYASEDVAIASEIYSHLERRGVRVFFDRRQMANLWGKDLSEELADIYRARSKYCLMIVSAPYAEKKWTRHERRSALARALSDGAEYILPLRVEDVDLPGLPDTIAYLDAGSMEVRDIADLILEKLGMQNERSLCARVTELYGRLPPRVACNYCGSRWTRDNIHLCSSCSDLYCIDCVWNLKRPDDGLLSRWICNCGGWIR